jgi:hypothetical protein
MLLSKNDQNELWKSIEDIDLQKYTMIEKTLKEQLELKKYPIRIFVTDNRPSTLFYSNYKEKENFTLQEFIENKIKDFEIKKTEVVVQGVSPALETPIDWLCNYCSHPDGFLYIVLKIKE